MLIEEITTTPNSIKQQLLNCYQQNEWRPHDLDEAQDFDVRFLDSPMFAETFKQKTSSNPGLANKFEEFKYSKTHNPLQSFGSKDYPMLANGPIGQSVPGMRHAHLTQDISVFYTIEGRNPTLIKLYGLFSHADSGTGSSANNKRQQRAGKQMKNQTI
jgi:hypothetical protein